MGAQARALTFLARVGMLMAHGLDWIEAAQHVYDERAAGAPW